MRQHVDRHTQALLGESKQAYERIGKDELQRMAEVYSLADESKHALAEQVMWRCTLNLLDAWHTKRCTSPRLECEVLPGLAFIAVKRALKTYAPWRLNKKGKRRLFRSWLIMIWDQLIRQTLRSEALVKVPPKQGAWEAVKTQCKGNMSIDPHDLDTVMSTDSEDMEVAGIGFARGLEALREAKRLHRVMDSSALQAP